MKAKGFFFTPRARAAAGWVCALLLVASLARLGAALRGMRHARGGIPADARGGGVPPALNAVMMGLGGFRGILAETLWFRMERLQTQGRFLEINQLADWITRLDPSAAEAWIYNAWNLAYNVSAMMQNPGDRLRWVVNGIRLLRDDALAWCPGEPGLHRELAGMYRNKIGSPMDRAHTAYKRHLAREMAPFCNPDGTLADGLPPAGADGLRALRLDPGTMRALQGRFGPMDWRVPASHALYWAMSGLALADGADALPLRREAYIALVTACHEQGRLTGGLGDDAWSAAPNPGLADGAEAFLRETWARFPRGGVANVYAHFLARRIRDAPVVDARVPGWHADLRATAPAGMAALPLDVLRGAPAMPAELFHPVRPAP